MYACTHGYLKATHRTLGDNQKYGAFNHWMGHNYPIRPNFTQKRVKRGW